MRHEGTTALVTGASSGIGAAFARRLADRGADVVLVARREDALRELAAEITARTGRRAHAVVLDLGVEDVGRRLKERLDADAIAVDTVVNCAGAGITRPFVASTVDDVRAQLRLDVAAVVEVSRAFLPAMVASGHGALVNVGSLTGYVPVPGMAVYAASKAFVVRFTEAIAHELRATGVTVVAVSPGPTRTEFFARSGTSTRGTRFQTPDDVVSTALRALDRRHPPVSVVSGRVNRLVSRLLPLLPRRTTLHLAGSRPAT